MRTPLLFLVAMSLAGCLTADSFATRSTAATCKRYEECFKADFDASFDDQKECREEVGSFNSDCFQVHCEFDKENAASCLKDIAKQSCSELSTTTPAACTAVYRSCDEVALGLCLLSSGFDTF